MNDRWSHCEDEDLVRRAIRGEAAAFEELYDRHVQGVARALASFAGCDHDLLDDLVQDVFLRVIHGLPSYAPTHPFSSWLFTIALNVGRNHARGATRSIPVRPQELVELAGSTTPTSMALTSAELMDHVHRLPLPLREVVSLRVGADMSYETISEMLEIPSGTARRRMHSAIELLREVFEVNPSREKARHE